MNFKKVNEFNYHKSNWIIEKLYYERYMRKAVELLNVKEKDIVLDYGCGNRKLKEYLPKQITYFGFDINQKEDWNYDKMVNKIVTLHTLEHLDKKELKKFFDYLEKYSINKIVCGLPLLSITNDVLAVITKNFYRREIEHLNNYKEINRLFMKKYGNTALEIVGDHTILTKWEK